MTGKDLFYALDGLEPELVMNAAPDSLASKRKIPFLKWATVAACLLLVIAAATQILPLLIADGGTDIGVPLPIDKEIIWYEDVGYVENASDGSAYQKWNGLSVDRALYEVLGTDTDGKYIAVLMVRADGGAISWSECSSVLDKSVRRDQRHGRVYLFVTENELAELAASFRDVYIFRLAKMEDYIK